MNKIGPKMKYQKENFLTKVWQI